MALNCTTAQDVAAAIEANGIKMVDVRFTDLFGQWHHFSMPAEAFDIEDAFEEGMGFDGSSIRGFQTIEISDMLLIGDPTTAFVDPIVDQACPTLSLVATLRGPRV